MTIATAPTSARNARATKSWASSLRLAAGDIKLAHSIFALPFAILAAFLAGPSRSAPIAAWFDFWIKLTIIVVCMVLARTWAMLVNRLVDQRIDADNARTSRRVFASGALSAAKGWTIATTCGVLFVLATGLFWWFFHNPWPMYLSAPVLAWIAVYSFTKRFTALCHLFLGASLAIAPVAAAIAVDPTKLFHTPTIWWLAGFVLLWVAGFDVIYALQDEQFDRARSLHSIPAALGSKGARAVGISLHVGAVLMLAAAWTSHPRLGPVMGAGVLAVVTLLIVEHIIVAISARRGLAGLNMACFTVNGIVSCVLGVLGVVDLLW